MVTRPKALFLLHLPPPVHGSSIIGLSVKESVLLNDKFEAFYVNLLASKYVSETGKITLRKLMQFASTAFKVLSLVILKRPRCCYLALTTTGAAFYRDFLFVIILKLFRIKRIYHLHNKGIAVQQKKKIHHLCYRYVFKNAEVIILSKHLYFDIQHFVPESCVHICPNGIKEESTIEEQLIVKTQSAEEEPIIKILFLSNLIESKGVFILLEALSLLKELRVKFECIFIGGEADVTIDHFNDRKEKLGLNETVFYKGKKTGIEKARAYSQADIFVFPTFYSNECFPLVLLEAMSWSLPIISTYEGGIGDIVENNLTGFLVEQKDTKQLADKLLILLQDSDLRARMGTAARNKYQEEFTLAKFELRLTEILEKSFCV